MVFDTEPLLADVNQLNSKLRLSYFWVTPVSSGLLSNTTTPLICSHYNTVHTYKYGHVYISNQTIRNVYNAMQYESNESFKVLGVDSPGSCV